MKVTQKPVILFDVDGTLVDTKKLLGFRLRHLKKSLITGSIIQEISVGVRFLINKKLFTMNPQKLENTFLQKKYIKKSLYDDVIPSLKSLQTHATLGIWSQSDIHYQMYKLRSSGILHFFPKEHIYIRGGKVQNIVNIADKYTYTRLIIIDNNIKNIQALTKKHIVAYHLNRSGSIISNTTIHSLQTIHKHISL